MLSKTDKKIKRVAFFGDAMLKKSDLAYQLALTTAALLAKNGYIVVNGGGPGIMGAATEGAKSVGGKVELVILDPDKEPNNYEGTDKENIEYASKVYKTETYEDRLHKLIEISDAFVVFKGGTGTLSEVGMVWEMAKFNYGEHEPVIFVGDEWREVVTVIEEKMNFEAKERRVVTTVYQPEDVLKALTLVES